MTVLRHIWSWVAGVRVRLSIGEIADGEYLRRVGAEIKGDPGGGGGGAPTTSEYLLAAADGALPNHRVLAPGANITLTPGSGTLTVAATVPTVPTATALLDTLGTTQGMTLRRGAGAWEAFAAGTSGHVLTSNGPGTSPTWQAPAGGGGGLTAAQVAARVVVGV